MKKIWFLTYIFFIFCLFSTCEKEYIKEDPTEGQSTGSDSGYEGVQEDDDDYVWSLDNAVQIILNGNSVSADTSGVTVNGTCVTITSPGTYLVSGILNDGQIMVNTEGKEDIKIILDNVNITCSASAPLYISSAKKVIIVMTDGSENILTDGATYTNLVDDEPNAALFSKSDLTIFGNGSLTVNANYNDGISSKDGLIIKDCALTVNSLDDGIRGKDYLLIHSGDITIHSGGDGLKSDNEDDTSAGFITIDTGSFDITSGGDAIAAVTDIVISTGDFSLTSGGGSNKTTYETLSAKGIKGLSSVSVLSGNFTINSADDAIHSNGNCSFSGGTLSLSSGDDGIHADEGIAINGSSISILKSYEGIESAAITIDQSTVRIVSSDDGFNATKGMATESNDNSSLTINSGYIYVNSSRGDALDANGNITINGGIVVAHGPSSQPEVGMDYNGICKVLGGLEVISGSSSNMTQAPSTGSTQYSVLIKFTSNLTANTIVHIEDESGNSVLTFAPENAYQSIMLSSSSLESGGTYTIYTGGSCTGTPTDGLYDGGTYTAGTLYQSFTISSIVTTIGSSDHGPGPGPGW